LILRQSRSAAERSAPLQRAQSSPRRDRLALSLAQLIRYDTIRKRV